MLSTEGLAESRRIAGPRQNQRFGDSAIRRGGGDLANATHRPVPTAQPKAVVELIDQRLAQATSAGPITMVEPIRVA